MASLFCIHYRHIDAVILSALAEVSKRDKRQYSPQKPKQKYIMKAHLTLVLCNFSVSNNQYGNVSRKVVNIPLSPKDLALIK